MAVIFICFGLFKTTKGEFLEVETIRNARAKMRPLMIVWRHLTTRRRKAGFSVRNRDELFGRVQRVSSTEVTIHRCSRLGDLGVQLSHPHPSGIKWNQW
jgi:hypothetical protein